MEPPPSPPISAVVAASTTTTTTNTTATTTTVTYPDSINSSPRSRATTDVDDPLPPLSGGKLRLMCSYGGHIVPRPHDKSLCYAGGDTRIVVVDRTSITLPDLLSRLSKTLLNGKPFNLKYQLPNEDLDSLISVSTEDDLDNMIDEYDRLNSNPNHGKNPRIRLFLFPSSNPEGASSIDGSIRSDDWFLNALNSVNSESDNSKELGKLGNQNQSNPDIQSVSESPIIDSNSSFGSSSSNNPSVANLPPVRVHGDDGGGGGGRVSDQTVGIEERFGQMGVHVVSSPPPTLAADTAVFTGVPAGAVVVTGEFPNWVFSDNERLESVGQQKQIGGEIPSPDSVSSDNGLSNPISRQKTVVYQDPVGQLSSGSNRLPPNLVDPNTGMQMQQLSESGYALPPQYNQQQAQAQLQAPQYVHAGPHFVHHPSGSGQFPTYFSVYPPQQPHHQYPMYYVPAGQTPPNPTILSTSSALNSKSEMAPGVYRTATSAGPQLVQVLPSQHQPQPQFMGYSQMHHPSQSIAPNSASYAYEYADPGHTQMYYTQAPGPTLAAQYRPDENVKQ